MHCVPICLCFVLVTASLFCFPFHASTLSLFSVLSLKYLLSLRQTSCIWFCLCKPLRGTKNRYKKAIRNRRRNQPSGYAMYVFVWAFLCNRSIIFIYKCLVLFTKNIFSFLYGLKLHLNKLGLGLPIHGQLTSKNACLSICSAKTWLSRVSCRQRPLLVARKGGLDCFQRPGVAPLLSESYIQCFTP